MRTRYDDDDAFEIVDGRRLLKDKRTTRISLLDAERARGAGPHRPACDARDAVRLADNTPAVVPGSRPASYTTTSLDEARKISFAIEATRAAMSRGFVDGARPRHDTPLSMQDAERLRYDAWAASRDEMANAWRTAPPTTP
jgi:hypothetical protein